jgi:L-alanine-DL-glutamate epimerase-like enolase superfamily enzyme
MEGHKMKITEVEVIPLLVPDAKLIRSACVIRVHTDEGIEGIGEVDAPSLVVQAIIKTKEFQRSASEPLGGAYGLETSIVGEDPTQVERLWQKMYQDTFLYGRGGAVMTAMTGIDIALWDIAGKAQGKPICELLSGTFDVVGWDKEVKSKVKPYATVYLSGKTPKEVEKNFRDVVNSGFGAAKLESEIDGFGLKDVETDISLVEAARKALGDKRDLIIDAQYCWTNFNRALAIARKLVDYNVFFLEAPFPPDCLEAYARLSQAIDTPVSCGDGGDTTRRDFLDLMERGKVGVVQPSIVRAGGITGVLRIAELAFERGVLCIPHCWARKIGVAAEAHLAAVVPNMPYIEYPFPIPPSSLVSELVEPSLLPKNGLIDVPKSPGLGIKLNEKFIEKYRVDAF